MTNPVSIYHNPRCSKSRQTLELLQEKGINPEIVLYLDNPPTKDQIQDILNKLSLSPRGLMRTKEAIYKDNGLNDESLTDDELVQAMVKFPKLIERPIVLANDKAAVGRPPESVLDIL